VQTGGTKGSDLSFTPHELRGRVQERIGVEPSHVIAEYGMTEACSQFYERELRDAWETSRAGEAGCAVDEPSEADMDTPRLLHGPPWARAVVCDVETLRPAKPSETGVIRIVDLANLYSLAFLQTEDLGVAEPAVAGTGSGAFRLLGRASGAETRGCSLTAEEWLRHARGAAM
jgi:hypothetical protein